MDCNIGIVGEDIVDWLILQMKYYGSLSYWLCGDAWADEKSFDLDKSQQCDTSSQLSSISIKNNIGNFMGHFGQDFKTGDKRHDIEIKPGSGLVLRIFFTTPNIKISEEVYALIDLTLKVEDEEEEEPEEDNSKNQDRYGDSDMDFDKIESKSEGDLSDKNDQSDWSYQPSSSNKAKVLYRDVGN